MTKNIIKKIISLCGGDPYDVFCKAGTFSIRMGLSQCGFKDMTRKLREVQSDISKQESKDIAGYNAYYELKARALHAFQCTLMLRALEKVSKNNLIVLDVGDSAGTHLGYLKRLTRGRFDISGVSVNLDLRAVNKIREKGMEAVLCSAEHLDLMGRPLDLCVSFQTVEHLHNPALFFYSLAKKSACDKLVVTVPYLAKSRVGLQHVRRRIADGIHAEEEHIFELSPQDWELLMLHAGWKAVYSQVYYQYPRNVPVLSGALRSFWKKFDFEGFWGVILEKDTTYSDKYYDWQE